MYGVFRLKPNDRNVRDLDIEVDVDFQVYKLVFVKIGFVWGEIIYFHFLGGIVSNL